ncbi:MAG: GTP cyclohydrolase I [Niabella sp.]|jgi:GTP cyclohydrolase I|nr:MAG: GTP cyclohydrolase I [Niabella sp.]HRE56786.1 GTP cyclohydrolase I [Candidatus Kapabacteria bacterium]HRK58877.1 GTP cyclohydrolase I [Candidatus Kapabacteria bacterium]
MRQSKSLLLKPLDEEPLPQTKPELCTVAVHHLDRRRLFDANGNQPLTEEERQEMQLKLEQKFGEIFEILRIDRKDPNSTETPRRLAKMWVNELFIGRYTPPPPITVFPNRKEVDELVISTGIKVMSVCSHHWQTISGTCSIGYLPDKYVIGLSKLNRIVEWFARRGQIQEELGEQIADFLEDLLKPKALGVIIKSKHYCMIARGVNESEEKALMTTSVMRGELRSDASLRHEFLRLLE